MYKLLLCWRYLRTRWIALASIVSVTLGVATLIVVNSVMDGFTEEMHDRIHGILSDIVVESHSNNGIADSKWFESQIRKTLEGRLEGLTTVVAVPAMLNFSFNGANHTQQINLIGIDQQSYASVSDFSQYLLHPDNQKQIDFQLRELGFAPGRETFPESGWSYRRNTARLRKEIDREMARNRELRRQIHEAEAGARTLPEAMESDKKNSNTISLDTINRNESKNQNDEPENSISSSELASGPSIGAIKTNDDGPHYFDAEHDVHIGIVLGIGIGSMRFRDPDGEVRDLFFIRPGDDVTVSMPGAGNPPRAIDQSFTVVDLYESKMSEYESTFSVVPRNQLQKARGMIDPTSGLASVTSIQMKLKPGVDLAKARDDLRAIFPPEQTMVHVQSWRDSQGPLLAAVQLETTILNVLLFMIIAVAGFGILATFFMIVVEKTRDIGVLKSLGAPGSGIASIFLAYGLLLGFVGSGAGALLGLLFVWKINTIANWIEVITGREVFDPTVYYFTEIPTIIHPWMVVWVVIGAMLIAVMASVLPSIRAARMHPVQALRYE